MLDNKIKRVFKENIRELTNTIHEDIEYRLKRDEIISENIKTLFQKKYLKIQKLS